VVYLEGESLNLAFVKVPQLTGHRQEIEARIERFGPTWKQLFKSMTKEGSLWVFARNSFADGELVPVPLHIGTRIAHDTEFVWKNIFTIYREQTAIDGKAFVPAYYQVLFFAKDAKGYFFDKNAIKEPHVFKEIEWGRRTKGSSGYDPTREKLRYGEGGRDPGNVLYKVKRKEDGSILSTEAYTDEEVYDKFMRLSSKKTQTIGTNIEEPSFLLVAARLGRVVEVFEL